MFIFLTLYTWNMQRIFCASYQLFGSDVLASRDGVLEEIMPYSSLLDRSIYLTLPLLYQASELMKNWVGKVLPA